MGRNLSASFQNSKNVIGLRRPSSPSEEELKIMFKEGFTAKEMEDMCRPHCTILPRIVVHNKL